MNLDAIDYLLERVGHPERRYDVLHIAGSKGKGSTALFAEALLSGPGRRVGTFTSPHLTSWTERFRIDRKPVDPPLLVDELRRIAPHVDRARATDEIRPSFFDVTTALAFAIFSRVGVTTAIVEVGLGGRLDSTNIVRPRVACITSIELEHTDRLGNTLAAIAGEKAGIIKPGVPVVVGDLAEEALRVVEARAEVCGARPLLWGRDFGVRRLETNARGVRAELFHGNCAVLFEAPLLGSHNAHNAALALTATRILGAKIDPVEAASRLAGVELPGRLELRDGDPLAIIDSAHTEVSFSALAETLELFPGRPRDFVFSLSEGKRPSLLGSLLRGARRVTLTRADPDRSIDVDLLARAVRDAGYRGQLSSQEDPELAVRSALDEAPAGGLLCIAGSVYLAGIARRILDRGTAGRSATPKQSARVGSSHNVRGEG